MRQEIDQSDINQMNNLIFKKVNEQFETSALKYSALFSLRNKSFFDKIISVIKEKPLGI